MVVVMISQLSLRPLVVILSLSTLIPIANSDSPNSKPKSEPDFKPDYKDALAKSVTYFQGQRSGKLPPTQTINWRSHSGLTDGQPDKVDLVGGYYDAGDNIKFGLPLAFTTTLLSWSVIELKKKMPPQVVDSAHEAIRWAADYLLKVSAKLPDALYVQVGDAVVDHKCWIRPEDLPSPQPVYKVTPSAPGSDVAGETAAALAAASRVFKPLDADYGQRLLDTAKKAFAFADKHKAKYSDSLHSVVCPFYCSYNGFTDELQWAAAWLYKATKNSSYLQYAISSAVENDCDVFNWDSKLPGTRVLLSKYALAAEGDKSVARFNEEAKRYICNVLPNLTTTTVKYTPGGLMYKTNATILQHVTASSFLFIAYAKYLKTFKQTFKCDNTKITPSLLRHHAKKQTDYILGANPKGMSYMVGFGEKYPQKIHHRGSSLPSVQQKAQHFGCSDAFQSYYHSPEPNPNILIGAVVGGPDHNDEFKDDRDNFAQSEPATYINAPLVGTLTYLAANF